LGDRRGFVRAKKRVKKKKGVPRGGGGRNLNKEEGKGKVKLKELE